MPTAPLKACSRCATRYSRRCPACSRNYERWRGSSASRGYGEGWRFFRARFLAMLLIDGIVPRCGAALPCGPQTSDGCGGLLLERETDYDHEPPLSDIERLD